MYFRLLEHICILSVVTNQTWQHCGCGSIYSCIYRYSIPNKNGARGREVIFVKNTMSTFKRLNCELIWNEVWTPELNCELNWDEILMVELNRESNFDAMSILKNWIWIESKHLVWIWIESWIQKSWIVTSLSDCHIRPWWYIHEYGQQTNTKLRVDQNGWRKLWKIRQN